MQLERGANGLRVVVAPQPHLRRAHVALYVRVGSRFETAKDNGLSHFLEHMLYRGTPRLVHAHDVNLAVESLGGYLYAATHVDFGVFSITMPPASLDQATPLFGEILQQPTFADIEVEKEIVCEEILEDLDDDGRQIDADNLSRRLIYPSHPLGYTITGDEDGVRSFTRDMLRAHHARHYTAENCVLVFTGAVDPARAFELADRSFGGMPRGARVPVEAPRHTQTKPRVKVVENVASQTELRLSLRAIAETAQERPALELLMRVIDDGMSTRLYHRICDERGLCYDVSASYDGYEDDGVVDFAAGCQHTRSSVVAREILAMMRELAEQGPTEEELAKAKRRHVWDLDNLHDDTEDLASFHGTGLMFERHRSVAERRAETEGVTLASVREVAAALAQPSRLNAVAVGLLEDGEEERFRDVIDGFRGV